MAMHTKQKALQTFIYRAYANFGGANQSRTGLTGFAIRGITALLSRRYHKKPGAGKRVRTVDLYLGKVSLYQLSYSRKSKSFHFLMRICIATDSKNLERENGFEPSTYTLARYRSTN